MPVAEVKGVNAARSSAMTNNDPNNPHITGIAWRPQRDPQYHVYVYNLSARTFEGADGAMGRIRLRVPGVTEDDPVEVGLGKPHKDGTPDKVIEGDTRYHYVTSFPQPMLLTRFDDAGEQIDPVETDAVRFVVDQIWPDNPTRSLDIKIPDDPRYPQSSGNNYALKGVFFSLTNPPMKEDVDAARKRMEGYYTYLLNRAGALEHTNKEEMEVELRTNADYPFAASYYGKKFTWNQKNVRTEECSNCGEQKPANRKFHTASWGLCVERSQEAWKAVVESGVRTYDAVPDEFKWRKEKPVDSK